MSDLISKSALIKTYCEENCGERKCVDSMDRCIFISHVLSQPTVEAKPEWIPFKTREADEEEKEAYGWEEVLCCKMPDEDEEILVSYASGCVDTDIFLREGTEVYLESGAEFMTQAVAWMPLPETYNADMRKKVE